MADIPCPKCWEPWEVYHLRHDAHFEDEPNAPKDVPKRACPTDHDGPITERPYCCDGTNEVIDFMAAIIRGFGCPACWDDPSRIIPGDEGKIATAEALVYDAVDDEDHTESLMELFG